MKLLDRVRSYMLGTAIDDDDDDFYDEDSYDDGYEEEPRFIKRERERDNSSASHRKSRHSDSNIVNMPASYSNPMSDVRICKPVTVDDATVICDLLKSNVVCAVNLEGVERLNAQRIADFLSGSCFALSGEIQRINNEIFLIAPVGVNISSELRNELKDSSLVVPWISSALR